MTRVLITSLLAALVLGTGMPTAMAKRTPRAKITNMAVSVTTKTARNLTPAAGTLRSVNTGGAPAIPSGRALSANIVATDIKGAQPKDKVEVKYETCANSNTDCTGTRAGCITESGDPNYFQPPTITYVSVNDGPWRNSRTSCGVADSVTIDQGPGQPPLVIPVRAPPVPTFAQIQTAFKELPFSKPTVTVEPKGMKTLINFTTYYAATWPEDTGLQPGETSKPVTLLSWTIDFRVDAQDYRYDYGDGTHSEWTTSPGGTHLDGDITHKYSKTGDVDIKVDARLTGQYRVNGGEWQDIATTADLQDEPVDTLTVVGTKTRLTADEG